MESREENKERNQTTSRNRPLIRLPRSPFSFLLSSPRASIAAALAASALIYLHSLGNEFVFDDREMIVLNRYIGNWSFLWESFVHDSWWFRDPAHLPQGSYYRPIQDLWLWINFHLFGLNPAGWHAASLALHLIVVGLVYRVASAIAGDPRTGAVAALLFGLMPVHAEAIVWASATPIPIAAAFELAAFDYYLRGNRRALSLGLFGGALLSHESAIVFPALIAAHSFLLGPDKTYRTYKSYVSGAAIAALPYAIEAAAYLALRWRVIGLLVSPVHGNRLTALQAMLTIPGTIGRYSGLLILPWMAGPAHSMAIVRSAAAPQFYVPVLGIAGIAVLCGAAFLLLRESPRRRLYLFCLAWTIIALAPALNLAGLPAATLIQDRYLYLPSFGLCVIGADLALRLTRRGAIRARIANLAIAAAAIGFAAILFHVESYWHDEMTLFTRCIENAPGGGIWHNRRGLSLARGGDFSAARRELEQAATLEPDDATNLYNLALIDEHLGDRRAAAGAIARWIKLLGDAPPPNAYTALALAADAAGDREHSEAALARAAALPGGAEAAALTRAQIAFRHGDAKRAEAELREILARDPDNAEALTTLGTILASANRGADALAAYRRAESLTPESPSLHYKIALILHRMGRDEEARRECALAIAGAPGNPTIRDLMNRIEGSGK